MWFKTAKQVAVAVIGGTIVLLGLVLLFTPGPALLVIPMGLAVLATEFAWARRLLRRVKRQANDVAGLLRRGKSAGTSRPVSPTTPPTPQQPLGKR